ncbi:amidohydrolase [Actinotalea fermentans]|uniref:Amidohydrolase n=1 Tax=Actinotalea fermentans TaxID=43671 RepID=A0A511YUM9_9CELL|nr:amidohydrolase family protein [Actinotalea fermentans]GEN78900.1 amidohydrolase [Actinotalea fermentans]
MRTVYRNGVVHAAGVGTPTALVVEDAEIAWIGADADAPSAVDAVVDLGGALVTPGFVDAHAHVLETGLAAASVDLGQARSLQEALDRLAGAASSGVVVAHGWDESTWPEGRPPTGEEVARAVGHGAAYVLGADLRRAVVTGALADAAGSGDAEDGGSDGTVHGPALARAREALVGDAGRREALLRAGLAEFARQGVVWVHEISTPDLDSRSGLAQLLGLTAERSSGLPAVVGYRAEVCEDADQARRLAEEIPGLAGVGAVVDGTIADGRAALRAPYADDGHGHGDLLLTAEQVANHVGAATRARLQAVLAVTGDRAMAEVLLGFQAAADVEGVETIRAAGHRLEHAAMVDTPALARILVLGLTVSGQPTADAAWGGPDGLFARRLGPVRAANLHAFADLAGAGVPLVFGSGSPAAGVDPWGAVRAAVHHHEPSQRLSLAAAFAAATRAGHRAARSAHPGTLRVGGPASFAAWRVGALVPAGGRAGATAEHPGEGLWLPDLSDPAERPRCVHAVRDGVVLYAETA